MSYFGEINSFLLEKIGNSGYLGIFLLMTIESSFFPFPSEIIMIPSGYLVQQGKLSLFGVILSGTLGSLLGALINYYLAYSLGRNFLIKNKKYFFITEKTFFRAEEFFLKHGYISTFLGRLIPGIRQYISIPAGLSCLDLKLFSLLTCLGAGTWVAILALLGYLLGDNQLLIKKSLSKIILLFLILAGFSILIYVLFNYAKKKKT